MDRVKRYADKIGGETILNYIAPDDWSIEANAAWAHQMLEEGRQIIDIGPDFVRRGIRQERGIAPASPAYELERTIFKGYEGYQKAFERFGKFLGNITGTN